MYFKTKLLNLSNHRVRKQLERKNRDTCLILHDTVTPLTTLLASEIKMAAQTPRPKVSDVLEGFL